MQYPAKFAEIIAINSYTPDQVFNDDEFELFWKIMLDRTNSTKAHKSVRGHKAEKSHNGDGTHNGRRRFRGFSEADIVELKADKELDEDDLVHIINETNDRDRDPDEEESESVTAKVIREELELDKNRVIIFYKITRMSLFQRDINKSLIQYEEFYKDLAKNQTQLFVMYFLAVVRRSDIVSNSSNIEFETYQVLSNDESDIIPMRKKRLIV
ncbi:uncharacterized protein CDAR_291561 [Caerostris darwini]|uniref:Uncharacterized protein n=1 Tax=Caerostris darwini TaxID=1538125 RepID=A0AAV4RIF3_9ARAC|nr:uncharacterized protein CDAR_291561 [Caerostris darwini]